MAISTELFTAILSMDAYNRGYSPRVALQGDSIGSASILSPEEAGLSESQYQDWIDAGFYAVAYDLNDQTIIAYRGTDALLSELLPVDFPIFTGDYNEPQIQLALEFYRAVAANTVNPISLTGHSLGGALAGFTAAFYERQSVLVDPIGFVGAFNNFREDYDIYKMYLSIPELERTQEQIDAIGLFEEVFQRDYGLSPNELRSFSDAADNYWAFHLEGSVAGITRGEGETESAQLIIPGLGSVADVVGGPAPWIRAHSGSLHAILMFADDEWRGGRSEGNWVHIAQLLLPTLFNSEISAAVHGDEYLLDRLAYSALDSGSAINDGGYGYVFGNTGIRALFDDAEELGGVVNIGNISTGLQEALSSLVEIFVQFAATMAENEVNYRLFQGLSDPIDPIEGVVTLHNANGQLTNSASSAVSLQLSLDPDLWKLGAGSLGPDVEILGLKTLLRDLLAGEISNLSEETVASLMELLYGGEAAVFSATKAISSVEFNLTQGPINVTLPEVSSDYESKLTAIYVAGDESDTIHGSNDNNMLFGSEGDDKLVGHLGKDILIGGEGADLFEDSVVEKHTESGRQNEDDIYIGDHLTAEGALDFISWITGQGEGDTLRYTTQDGSGQVIQAEGVEIRDLTATQIGGVSAIEVVVADLKTGVSGTDTLFSVEKIVLTDAADKLTLKGNAVNTAVLIDMGSGNNEVEVEVGPEGPILDLPASIFLNFSTTKDDGEDAGETTNVIRLSDDLTGQQRIAPILLVDGKQLVGGAAFDFDKFDLVGGETSVFGYLKGVPEFLPTASGGYGVSTTDRVQQWLSEHATAYQQHISNLTTGGGLFGTLIAITMASMMLTDLSRLKEAWSDQYVRVILGTQGESYILENEVYDQDGKLESADLTIEMNLEQDEPYQIKIEGWKQGDLGIQIDTLDWRNGLDSGTNKNGQLDDWRDLSIETIREKLSGLGIEAREIVLDGAGPDGVGGSGRSGPASTANADDPTALSAAVDPVVTGGISRGGNAAANTLVGTGGADILNGRQGDDELRGEGGRDIYVFRAGDGHDVIVDGSLEGNVIRFLDGIDPAQLRKTVIAGANGASDLLIEYGQGDTIRIVGWSQLTPEQQALWTFDGVTADLSSPDSTETPDISVLPESQGGTAKSLISGTETDDVLTGLDISETLDGAGGNDVLHGGGGDDRLFGRAGNDIVNGGAGDDRLDGGSGEDLVRGGLGDDALIDSDGSDTYVFARGDGKDTLSIGSGAGTDTVLFEQIASEDIEIVRQRVLNSDDDFMTIVLRIKGTGDQITLWNPDAIVFDPASPSRVMALPGIERFAFSDGVEWSLAELMDRYYDQATTAGNDYIFGSNSARTISGGKGDDTIIGWGRGETFSWERGDGNDTIEQVVSSNVEDTLVLGAGISSDDVTFLRPNVSGGEISQDLVVSISGTDGGSVRIPGFFAGRNDIGRVTLKDGTSWTRSEITQAYLNSQSTGGDDAISGSFMNDVLTGGGGDDRLDGGDGSDTFRFAEAFGQDVVVLNNDTFERIEFSAHGLSDFLIRHDGADLVLQAVGTNDQVTLEDFQNLYWSLDSFGFAGGAQYRTSLISTIADLTTAATNLMSGGASTDILVGTASGDLILSHDGTDTVSGGEGNDVINGGGGADVLNGGLSADLVLGGAGNDQVRGDAGDDLLFGGTGDDQIQGGAGSDQIFGEAGNDTLAGDVGNDTLTGGNGSDTYVFSRGDGIDTIDTATGRGVDDAEVIQLVGGITAAELNFSFTGLDLRITFDQTPSDHILIKNFLASGVVAEIHAGSETLSLQDILDRATGIPAGDGTVSSNGGGVVYGGRGSDTLVGSLGRERFIYNRGDGADVINDWAGAGTVMLAEADELILTGGIRPEDLILSRSGTDLSIQFANSVDRIDIARQFHSWDYTGGVEAIRFDDGTVWSKADIRQHLLSGLAGIGDETLEGTVADDVFIGTAGDDVLRGDGGDDSYLYDLGNGHDVIDDGSGSNVLQLGAGILPGSVMVERSGDAAVLRMSANESVTITDLFSRNNFYIQFENGTRWTNATIEQKLIELAASQGNDTIIGSSAADAIAGGIGNDNLRGGDGGDTYFFALGDGVDVVTETVTTGTDVLQLGPGLLPSNAIVYRNGQHLVLDFGTGDQIILEDHFLHGGSVELVKFATGEIWSGAQLTQKAVLIAQTPSDDILIGSSLTDRFEGGEGNDSLNGLGGVDTYLFKRGDGVDTVNDYGPESGADVIEFGEGIQAADVDLFRSATNPDDLVISLRGSTDRVIVSNQYVGGGIGVIQFADGTQWGASEIARRADNVAPQVVMQLADQIAEQGTHFTLELPETLFADIDPNDSVSITATLADGSLLPTWLRFDGQKFVGTPRNENVGSISLRLTAVDSVGDSISQYFQITVENVNDAPIAVIVPNNQTATAGVAFTYQLPAGMFVDPDNLISVGQAQLITFSARLASGEALPSWLAFDPATGTFSGTPAIANNGVLNIIVTASDGSASTSTQFGIAIGAGNTLPRLGAAIPALTAVEDTDFTFVIPNDAFVDITPGDQLRYSAELSDGGNLPSWLKLDPITGQLSGKPYNADVGSLQITLTATDVYGASVSTTFTIEVGNSNDAPVREAALNNFVLSEGSAFSYVVPSAAFSDVDVGDVLTLSASLSDGAPLPHWLSFDPSTRSFSGTPDDGDVGFISVRLTATDSAGATTESLMYLVVGATNDAPTVSNEISDFIVDQYSIFEFTIPGDSFADIDSGGLSYTAKMVNGDPLPNWLSFDQTTATFSGRPDDWSVDFYEGQRVYQIEITARDSDGAGVSQIIDFTVRGPHPGVDLRGGSGNDVLDGTLGPDQLYGGSGNDVIWGGGQGNDRLYGEEGNDQLLGDWGNDTLAGGAGDDTLIGGNGVDTYLFGRGDGQDVIARGGQENSDDVIRLGSNILPSNINVSREGIVVYSDDGLNIITAYDQNDLKLAINGTSESITVDNQFGIGGDANNDYFVGVVEFANGVVWNAAEISARFMQSTAGDDFIQGDFRNNNLIGGAGSDRLLGLGGNDTLDGGAGNDDLYGGYGDDLYLFGRGSGHDRIVDFEGGKTYSTDTLRFGPGIALSDLVLVRDNRNPYDMFASREAGSLLIKIAGTNDSIQIFYQYAIEGTSSAGIDRFEFDDGTVLTREQLDLLIGSDSVLQGTDGNDSINGTSIDERIVGGKGDDLLYGNDGNDTYVWNLGDGNDRISEDEIWSIDILEFGLGIEASDVRLLRDSNWSYIIEVISTGERITVVNGASIDVSDTWEFENPIDEIRFVDGTTWTSEEILAFFVTGTPGDDLLIGFDPLTDILDGGTGTDRLEGRGGADVYVFGRGYGTDTIYDSGSGYIFYNEQFDFDTIRFRSDVSLEDLRLSNALAANGWGDLVPSLAISIVGTTDTLILLEDGKFIERLHFESTNLQLSASILRDIYYAQNLTAGDDNVVGFGGDTINTGAGNDILTGRLGDILVGGEGNDTYLYNRDTEWYQTINDAGLASDNDVLILDDTFDDYGFFERSANGRDLYIFDSDARIYLPIVLQDFFLGSSATVDTIRFFDGVEWNRAQIVANSTAHVSILVTGTTAGDVIDGDDDAAETITGGLGDDTLTGGDSGGDVYIWKKGDGNDSIVERIDNVYSDILRLTDVGSADISLLRVGEDLRIRVNSTGEQITISGHFKVSVYNGLNYLGIAQIIFDDGTLWRRTFFDEYAYFEGTTGADTIVGSLDDDKMVGLNGDDTYTINHVDDVIVEAADGGIDTVQTSVSYVLAANTENLMLLGSASINGEGNSSDNILTGNSASNRLLGGAGNDKLDGRGGSDTLVGGGGDDVYVVDNSGDLVIEEANEGVDTVQTSTSHILAANIENGLLLGTSGLTLTGNTQANVLVGNGGNNTLAGLQGADTLDGGAGSDTASYAASGSGIRVSLKTGLASGGDAEGDILLNIENITGSVFDDVIEGSAGTNILNAGTGTDTLSYANATAGIAINIGSTNSQATGGAGTDTVLGFENVLGSGFNDTITGSSNANVLTGALGIDTMLGKAGGDRYVHRNGDGNDIINDDSGSTSDVDILDLLHLTSADVLLSRVGQELTIRINATNELVTVRYQFYSSTENWGVERIEFADAIWDLATVNANAWLRGTSAADTLTGATTNDTLDGGGGNDTLSGGAGHDTYIYAVGYGNDIVSERTTGADIDVLDLVGLNPSDVRFERNTADLTDVVIRVISTGATVTLDNQFDLEGGVERILFADGSSIGGMDFSLDDLLRRLSAFYGTGGDDTITAGVGVDLVRGMGGNDLINGGAGADVLEGGSGNDTYIVDQFDDLVVELDGEGTDTVQSSVSFILGNNVENLTITGSAAVSGTGNNLANVVLGNSGNNLVAGLAGADTLNGGSGTDTATYASSNGGISINLLTGTATGGDAEGDTLISIENLIGSQLADFLTGNTGVNVLSGLGGDDTLEGGGGNDTLDGGEGIDLLRGGVGNDIYIVDDVGDSIVESLNEGTDLVQASVNYTLGSNVENLTLIGSLALSGIGNALANTLTGNTLDNELSGGDGNDSIYGMVGDDTLHGGTGNDAIDGGSGADTMYGGIGNDSYVVDDYGDTVFEYQNEGTDSVSSSVTFVLGAHFENLTLTGSAQINGTGNDLANTIAGNSGDNWLYGYDGNDSLSGGSGNDVLVGGGGSDTLNGGAGADQMAGGAGDDTYTIDNAGDEVVELFNEGIDSVSSSITYTLRNNFERLTLTGSSALNGTGNELANFITGNSGANIIEGLGGADTLNGAGGIDTLSYVSSSSAVSVNLQTATVSGGHAQGDVISNFENVWGSELGDVITGSAAANSINGRAGNDTINGGDGVDTLMGGAGDDELNGGEGSDIYIYARGDGHDSIIEIANNEGTADRLVFTNINPAEVTLIRNGTNLTIVIAESAVGAGDGGSIFIQESFGELYERGIEEILFADSTLWMKADMLAASVEEVEPGDVTIMGTAGDDTLSGTSGADIIFGDTGDDLLQGGAGADTYVYRSGDGSDYLDDEDGSITDVDVLRFDNLGYQDVTFAIDGGSHLYVTVDGTGDQLTLDEQYYSASEGWGFERMEFADGVAIALQHSKEEVWLYTGSEGADHLVGAIWGKQDVFIGGQGDDYLNGEAGSDTYVYAEGDGSDYIDDEAGFLEAANLDVLKFTDLNYSDVVFSRDGSSNLLITVNSRGHVITLDEQYYDAAAGWGIEKVQFADGMTIDLQHSDEVWTYNGTSNDDHVVGAIWGKQDVFIGGQGDDYLNGEAGSDTYVYAEGDGSDYIDDEAGFTDSVNVDVLRFTDLNQNDMVFTRSGVNLEIAISSTGDTITVDEQFFAEDGNWGIEKIEFADGTVWDRTQIQGAAWIRGTTGNDTLVGTSGNDTLFGDVGNDTITTGAGIDIIVFKPNFGMDTITDFQAGAGSVDAIELADSLFADFEDVLASAAQVGSDTLLTYDAQNAIILKNVALTSLHQDDFRFVA